MLHVQCLDIKSVGRRSYGGVRNLRCSVLMALITIANRGVRNLRCSVQLVGGSQLPELSV